MCPTAIFPISPISPNRPGRHDSSAILDQQNAIQHIGGDELRVCGVVAVVESENPPPNTRQPADGRSPSWHADTNAREATFQVHGLSTTQGGRGARSEDGSLGAGALGQVLRVPRIVRGTAGAAKALALISRSAGVRPY